MGKTHRHSHKLPPGERPPTKGCNHDKHYKPKQRIVRCECGIILGTICPGCGGVW